MTPLTSVNVIEMGQPLHVPSMSLLPCDNVYEKCYYEMDKAGDHI